MKESDKKQFSATLTCRPSFHDVDPMSVVWHGNYAKFFEKVREEIFRQLNFGYQKMRDSGYVWPIVDIKIKFRRPWHLEEEAEITGWISEYENRLVIKYQIFSKDTQKLLTEGSTTQMAFDLKNKQGLLRSPPILFEVLGVKDPLK